MLERRYKLYQRKNRKGFGVPEALVALAILGISAVGLYEFMGGVEKVVYRTEQMGEMEGVLDQVSDSARKILTQTGTAAAPVDGICRVMTLSKDSIPVTSLSSGVMEIDLALFRSLPSGATNDPANIDAFAANPPKRPNDMWSMAFDSTKWTLQPNCWTDLGGDANQLGRYQRCYTPVLTAWPELGDATKLAAKEMRIQVALTPVKLNAVGTGLMQKSNNLEVVVPPKASEPLKKINARDHGFLITSKISWKSTAKTEIRTHYNVVWAGEYTCLYGNKTSGGVNIPIYLNPSGIGSGTKSSTAVEIFSANHNIDEVKVEWLDTTYSVAKIENIAGSGKRAVTLSGSDGVSWGDNNDHRASFTAACQEQQFKCKKSTASRSWGPLITLNTLIRYRSSIAQDSHPALTFRRSTGGTSFETLTPGSDLGSSVVYHVNTSNPTQNYYNPTSNTLLLTRGLPSFGMQVNNAGGMCTRLCSNENKPEWQAYLNLGTGMDYKDDRNTGCVCCTMKQCAAIGNKSAACASQPIEPTDARVPECDSTDSVEVAKDINIISPAANQCVVARRNSAKTALEFVSRPCTDSNPYLCYAAGRYFVPKSGANAISGPFASAAQNCYALGLQTVDLTELRDLLTEQGNISTAGRSPLPPANFYDAG
ncbi:MAG: prepilin-type N-terminal cleavage/methylation domain-containing protein, partial [Proteobacteria bacterium]|nr:prepilin-type N-terminal cleavage/methylation domain-containing protein [Pseudomonadota bacterium]